jgi:hypothetical protein
MKRQMIRASLFCLILFAVCSNSPVFAETVYFLVAEIIDPPHKNDSYVLPLNDPCDIAYARKLVKFGAYTSPETSAGIAVAGIDRWDPNNGININRDYLQPGIPAWSWYVTEFRGFWEVATEVCDGWPTGVEEGLESWVGEYGVGQVCFYAYSVVAELGTDLEPWNCDLTVNGIVDFNDLGWFTTHWLDSGCCHRYYCEGTDINGSGEVDFTDFAIFANNWLWEEQ